jgi:sugar phosphate isomerase/epimerase
MRLGICTNPDKADIVKKAGFDYYEAKVFDMHDATEEQFSQWFAIQEKAGIQSEAMNCMLHQRYQVTGPNADHKEIQTYLEKAIPRCAKLGCKTIVFGSAWSRNMPEGFSDRDYAYNQITQYLHMASDICGENGITIAIEPLAANVTNILTFVAEGNYVCRIVDRENVKLLVDFFAASSNYENIYAILTGYAPMLEHIHFSAVNRKYPRRDDGNDYSLFFQGVKDSGYDKGISIEASHIGDEYQDMVDSENPPGS